MLATSDKNRRMKQDKKIKVQRNAFEKSFDKSLTNYDKVAVIPMTVNTFIHSFNDRIQKNWDSVMR